MLKREFFDEVSEKVTDVTGVELCKMLISHSEECTDAKYILVKALSKIGFSDTDISMQIGCTRQAVGYIKNNYKKSDKWILSNHWQIVSKWIESKYLMSK